MDVIQYKDFEVHAAPYQLADTKEWKINISIVKYHASHSNLRNFSAADSYETRTEAVKHCFQFGRQIINGQSPDCSVSDL